MVRTAVRRGVRHVATSACVRPRLSMSSLFAPMQKELPADAVLPGHQLLIRAGFIRKMESGIYTLLPLAMRTLSKMKAIIKDELDGIGAQQIHIPLISGSDVWKKTGRWSLMGKEMFKLSDRKGGSFCLAPTCEEAITTLVGAEVSSYRQLPLRLYQINPKFRDEKRPRFGLLRCREFIMKDMYTFDDTPEESVETYEAVGAAYDRIFARMGIPVQKVIADTGAIGGNLSHEYHILSPSGEDRLFTCPKCGYAANAERAVSGMPVEVSPNMKRFNFTSDDPDYCRIVAIVPEGREVNPLLVQRLLGGIEVRPDDAEVTIPTVILLDPACHETGDEFDSDFDVKTIEGSIKEVVSGDACSKCAHGRLAETRGIEIGHIFHLGTKYSVQLSALFRDQLGDDLPFNMGCYGIGLTRILQAVVEASATEESLKKGIRWPLPIAPYKVAILAAGTNLQLDAAQATYDRLQMLPELRGEVVLDDRPLIQIGRKFKEVDLVGFPFVVVVGRESSRGILEVQHLGQTCRVPFEHVPEHILKRMAAAAKPTPSRSLTSTAEPQAVV
ncbi:proline--tRNA ligase [Plasmodiophora brassicae]